MSTYVDFKLDKDMNLVIEGGDLVLTGNSPESVGQSIAQRLRTIKGEYYLDRTRGLPWFEMILRKNPNSHLVSTLFKTTILETNGVTKLNKFNYYFDTKARIVNVTFTVTVATGETLTSEVHV